MRRPRKSRIWQYRAAKAIALRMIQSNGRGGAAPAGDPVTGIPMPAPRTAWLWGTTQASMRQRTKSSIGSMGAKGELVSVQAAPVLPLPGTDSKRTDSLILGGGRARRRSYRPSQRPSRKRKAFKCPEACSAASWGDRFHHLTWTWSVAFEEASDAQTFLQWVLDWPGLDIIDSCASTPPRLCDPFFIFSIASHVPVNEFNRTRSGLHAHLLVGNVSYPELRALLSTWPGRKIRRQAIESVDHAWGAVHYVCSQDARTGVPLVDQYKSLLHAIDQGRGRGLLLPPFFSDNLEALADLHRASLTKRLTKPQRSAIARKAVRALNASRTPAERSEQASRAARARWDNRTQPKGATS